VPPRRERERADRRALILRTARSIAEQEGWDAVTTRRLAERIEYSQPVLYSHFAGKQEIVAAVAVEGFAELAAELYAAPDIVAAYVRFGLENPALYDAMFTLRTGLPWGTDDAPAPLREAFGVLRDALRPYAGEQGDAFTEVVWSALHGLVTLARSKRLRDDLAESRRQILTAMVSRTPGPLRPTGESTPDRRQ
jgi:AcrR family transcriptional regulator